MKNRLLRNYVPLVRDHALEPLSSHTGSSLADLHVKHKSIVHFLPPSHFPFFVLPLSLTSLEPFVPPYSPSLAPTRFHSFHHQFLISWVFPFSKCISPTGPRSLLWNNKLIFAKCFLHQEIFAL